MMLDYRLLSIQSIVKDAGFGGTCPIIVKADDKESIINIITSRIKSKKIFEVTVTSKCECLY